MGQAAEINVAEEHFATSTTKAVLAQLRLRAPMEAPNGKTLLAAAVMGNELDPRVCRWSPTSSKWRAGT